VQIFQYILPLFFNRGYETTDTAKVIGPILRTKTSRYLLFDLDHPEVSFRKIIIKGNKEVLHKPQGFHLVFDEAIQEVLVFTLLLFAPFGFISYIPLRRVGLKGGSENGLVASFISSAHHAPSCS